MSDASAVPRAFAACSFCAEKRVKEDAEGYSQTMIEGRPDRHGRRRARICVECVRHPERLDVFQTVHMKHGRGLKEVAMEQASDTADVSKACL